MTPNASKPNSNQVDLRSGYRKLLPRPLLAGVIIVVGLAVALRIYGQHHHVNYPLILSYIEAVKWPLFGLIVLYVLRPSLPGLAERLQELALGNTKAKFAPPKQKGPTTPEEKKVIREIQREPSVADNRLKDAPEFQLFYERIYRQIFSTQLEAIKRLETYSTEKEDGLIEKDFMDLLQLHQTWAQHGPGAFRTVRELMQFLIANSLVLYNRKKQYQIHPAGEEFLKYLRDQHLSTALIEL